MEEKKVYFVLGLKWTPIADPDTERDNPFQFDNLYTAFKFAEKVRETDEYATVVEVKFIEQLPLIK